jgi:hypothetical protein
MAFNPDDFQFERILPPEEKKPILEWDALHRLIVVRTTFDGEYVYAATKLSPQVNANLRDNLPNEWSNENDRIITFSVYETGEYLLEKEKLKFDFSTKQSRWIRYQYKEFTYGQVQELFAIVKAAIEVQRLDSEIELSKAIVDIATTQAYIEEYDAFRTAERDRLLRSSDWSQLPDAPETFDGEVSLWTQYRQYLRDEVKTPADFDDVLDYLIWEETFQWPIDPLHYHSIDPEHSVEYLSDPLHYSRTSVGSGRWAADQITGSVKQAAQIERARVTAGIPVAKQIWDKISEYKLNSGLTTAVIENLNIVEN